MKLKLLLLFLVVIGWSAWTNAQTGPYNQLLITEMYQGNTYLNYAEFTNMGDVTIDLSNFEFGYIGAWTQAWTPDANNSFRLPKKLLAPGKSFLISTAYDYNPKMFPKDPKHFSERSTKPEFLKIADMLLHQAESKPVAKGDSVTPFAGALQGWGGRETYYLRQYYTTLVDGVQVQQSVIIDQIGGVFDEADGTNFGGSYSVAGVTAATFNDILIRKNSVKHGVADLDPLTNAASAKLQFNATRGLDNADSEWIPVPMLGWNQIWRAVFWTAGNQVNAQLDANTLVSKTGKVLVDLAAGTITVPWGIRNDDSIMYQFERRPGLAWKYDYAPNFIDSTFISIRTGDKLTLYVCGDQVTTKAFNLIALAPTASDNIVIPKNGVDYTNYSIPVVGQYIQPYGGYRVTDGAKGMDSITHIAFATRADTLLKYLEKPTKATWKIVFKSGTAKPDLVTGDILRVTSENGKAKEYLLKLQKSVLSADAQLSSISWPDMPDYYKGDLATLDGWKHDTIPGFSAGSHDYVVKIPLEYQGIPSLSFTKKQLNAKVTVERAKNLSGTPAERTITWTVLAQDDSTKTVYTVRLDKSKDPAHVQAWSGEPFFSQIVFRSNWGDNFIELANPGTNLMDMSNYMIVTGGGTLADAFGANNDNSKASFTNAWAKYVPGKQWQSEADWTVSPRHLDTDLAVNAYVYPGDVFVMAATGNASLWEKEIDVSFSNNKNHWGIAQEGNCIMPGWFNTTLYLLKIKNDSVKNGIKAATNIADFTLLDVFGGGDWSQWNIGGVNADQRNCWTRKSSIYKGNKIYKGSFGTDAASSEWIMTNPDVYYNLGYPWPQGDLAISTGIGSQAIDDVTFYRSTVSSKVYKVSPGYTQVETIKGLKAGITVDGFYNNILKANALQALTVTSAANGLALGVADAVKNGDVLTVLSADSTNTSKYILNVTVEGLSSDATLTSAPYTIKVTGATGTIGGFSKSTLLKTVLENVTVPVGAEIAMTDANDAYMTLVKLRYDTTYTDVIATDNIYFEVIAENGITKVTYQLQPTVVATDAFVTSDVYSVDQSASVIKFVPGGTSAQTLLGNVTPAAGASLAIYDKAGFSRTSGDIYKDDKLLVTASDGITKKAYYFSMLNLKANYYLAFVISDVYQVEQINMVITGPALGTGIADFKDKLYPSFGATLKVIGANGNESVGTALAQGDRLLVTAADGITTATYLIDNVSGNKPSVVTSSIKMYPNPTDGKVVVQGLAKGNRVQVFNAAGVTLRDVIVENSTDYVSLESQPSGIYIFVVSAGTQHINIQKIVKK